MRRIIHPWPQINVAHQMDSGEGDKVGLMPSILCLVFVELEQRIAIMAVPIPSGLCIIVSAGGYNDTAP